MSVNEISERRERVESLGLNLRSVCLEQNRARLQVLTTNNIEEYSNGLPRVRIGVFWKILINYKRRGIGMGNTCNSMADSCQCIKKKDSCNYYFSISVIFTWENWVLQSFYNWPKSHSAAEIHKQNLDTKFLYCLYFHFSTLFLPIINLRFQMCL